MPHGYGVLTRVIDAATSIGWVSVVTGFQSKTKGEGRVTRIHPAGDLLQHYEDLGLQYQDLIAPPPDRLVILAMEEHGEGRRFVDRSEDARVAPMQDNLDLINQFFLTQCIYLNCSDELLLDTVDGVVARRNSPDDLDPREDCGPTAINFQSVAMCRIFAHGSLDKGGRFYRGWWQHIRSKYRERIMINDHFTVECDYSGMALVCLYAREHQTMDGDDPYDIELTDYQGSGDPRRKIVKKYLNAILNDSKSLYRVDSADLRRLGLKAKELRRRVDRKHKKIKHMFRTGVGLELQYIDSKIAEQVMLRFAEMGEVCLPVHDSFVVRRGREKHLLTVMQEEFERETGSTIQIRPWVGGELDGIGTLSDAVQPPAGQSSMTAFGSMMSAHLKSYSISMGYLNSWLEKTQSVHDRECQDLYIDELLQDVKWANSRP